MPTIKPVQMDAASPEQIKLMDGLKVKIGMVPNIYATIAHSPSTLSALLNYGDALKKGSLSPKEIESIALAVGQNNGCEYCVAAHTLIGTMAGLSKQDTIDARKGFSPDKKIDALIKLAVAIVATKGHPSNKSLEVFKQAGYSDAALVEVIAWVAHNVFTNYFNHIVGTEADFPKPPDLG